MQKSSILISVEEKHQDTGRRFPSTSCPIDGRTREHNNDTPENIGVHLKGKQSHSVTYIKQDQDGRADDYPVDWGRSLMQTPLLLAG